MLKPTSHKTCDCPSCKYVKRLEQLHTRVGNLMTQAGAGNEDVLRMGIVFVHATFENLLRELLLNRFLHGDTEWLREVGLLESTTRTNPKITLADLSKLPQEMTIYELLEKSVFSFLEKVSFNDSDQVVKWIERAGLDSEEVKEFLPQLSKGMARRHQIVHTFDIPLSADAPERITTSDVNEYFRATSNTLLPLFVQIREDPSEVEKHREARVCKKSK